jgi:hypothetical protein
MSLLELVYKYMIVHTRIKKAEADPCVWFSPDGIKWEKKPVGYQFTHKGYTMDQESGGITEWR